MKDERTALRDAISPAAARRFYDRLGARYDWFAFYEGRAKQSAFNWLELKPGMWLLNVGVGTGREHQLMQAALRPGLACGIDLSGRMVHLASRRTHAPLCQADARHLPFAAGSFDRLCATYVLDLMPTWELLPLLYGFRRVLRSNGWLVLVSLTEGTGKVSRALMNLWKQVYRLNPEACGGCRPLRLGEWVQEADFQVVRQQVVTQWAIPSEVVLAMPA